MPTTPAPDLPHGLDAKTGDYLRRLRTWMTQELERRVPNEETVDHILLTPGGSKTPANIVYKLSVDASGVMHTTQLPLGGGKP